MPEWLVGTMRVTVFPSDRPVPTLVESWWTQVSGGQFDEKSETRDAGIRYRLALTEPPLELATLHLRVDPIRIEWKIENARGFREAGGYLGALGDLTAVAEGFLKLLEPWFMASPAASRVAFGADLRIETSDPSESTRLIGEMNDIDVDEDTSDLQFRINRRVPSQQIDGVKINRLATWSTVMLGKYRLEVRDGGDATQSAEPIALTTRLELDINTAPDSERVFSPDQVQRLLRECVTLAIKMTVAGDRR